MKDVRSEIVNATGKWPAFNSAHEGYGVIAEEFIELQEWVFEKQATRNLGLMRKEAIQLAAMAIRFAVEVCNEEVGRK